jgi:predicted ribonuclease toxin of YeeF-YezG toxin-antitoxin module
MQRMSEKSNVVYAVPKPKHRKQQKAKNNPMPTAEDICTFPGCKKGFAHNHEVFFGKNRQNSIKYGMQKRLCYEHHNKPGGINPHYNKEIDNQYKQEAQRKFEAEFSRELFVMVFGRNYL